MEAKCYGLPDYCDDGRHEERFSPDCSGYTGSFSKLQWLSFDVALRLAMMRQSLATALLRLADSSVKRDWLLGIGY